MNCSTTALIACLLKVRYQVYWPRLAIFSILWALAVGSSFFGIDGRLGFCLLLYLRTFVESKCRTPSLRKR